MKNHVKPFNQYLNESDYRPHRHSSKKMLVADLRNLLNAVENDEVSDDRLRELSAFLSSEDSGILRFRPRKKDQSLSSDMFDDTSI